MRLDRFLSHATGLTRSQAQRAIRAGDVRVTGAVVTDPGAHVGAHSDIELAGRAIEARQPRYLMLHKPAGCVCATEDREHRTVLDLLDAQNLSGQPVGRSRHPVSRGTRASLHIVGRLDIDATGLVLITDDGDWSHRITSPRHKVPKSYRVTLENPLSEEAAASLRAGVALRNEPRRCAPAELERLADNVWRVTITEGKYHQVKRMFAAVGNRVLALHRERIGNVALDPELAPGEHRPLTADEIAAFRRPIL
jgi:16S rRNA pseudouridine516 synthase